MNIQAENCRLVAMLRLRADNNVKCWSLSLLKLKNGINKIKSEMEPLSDNIGEIKKVMSRV
jgi:hypothetical protein